MDETDLTCNKTLQLLHFELPRPFNKKQRSTCKHAGRITHSYTLERKNERTSESTTQSFFPTILLDVSFVIDPKDLTN